MKAATDTTTPRRGRRRFAYRNGKLTDITNEQSTPKLTGAPFVRISAKDWNNPGRVY